MTDKLRLSLLQMRSAATRGPNIAALEAAAGRAAAEGVELLALPECAGVMTRDFGALQPLLVPEEDDPWVAAARAAARRHGLWIHAGSTPVRGPGGKALNRALLVAPDGAVAARYDKIHLFDVFLDGEAPTGESRRYAPGEAAVLAATPWGPMGLAICYDLRFPALFRSYAQAGARLIFLPSAFTVPTGQAHWEVLIRARAIENGAFLVAPAQAGRGAERHEDGRETWGHSLVVSPWGEVLADLGETPGQVTLDLDLGAVDRAREQVPSLRHDRPFTLARAGDPPPAAAPRAAAS